MPQYDQVVLDALENKVTAKGTLKGHLDIYRYCDNVRRAGGGGMCLRLPLQRSQPTLATLAAWLHWSGCMTAGLQS